MSLGTYGGLKASVAAWLARSDLTSIIPDLIEGGLQRVNNELLLHGGLPDQEQVATASTVAGNEGLAVPTDFGSLRWIRLDNSSAVAVTPLVSRDYSSLVSSYGVNQGQPQAFATVSGQFLFRPIPDGVYTVRICYNKRYASFSADADTNYLLTAGGNLLLFAALTEAIMYLGDDMRVKGFISGYQAAMTGLRTAARKERHEMTPVQFDPVILFGSTPRTASIEQDG